MNHFSLRNDDVVDQAHAQIQASRGVPYAIRWLSRLDCGMVCRQRPMRRCMLCLQHIQL